MLAYLRSYRPLNLLLIGLAQLLSAYYLYFDASLGLITDMGIFWLIAATTSIAAFGYLVNDYFDVERDAINRPGKFNLRSLDNKLIVIHLLTYSSIVLYIGNKLGPKFLVTFIICSVALWLYNFKLKDFPLLGNILIASLSFLSVFIVKWMFPDIDPKLLIHFAALAGTINFCREVVKDAEDVRGDKETGSKTIPILWGYKFTNRLIYFSVLFVISFVVISVYYQSQYFKGTLLYVYWSYYLLFVVIPLYYIAAQIRTLSSKEDYKNISIMLKYVLFTGIISILFF